VNEKGNTERRTKRTDREEGDYERDNDGLADGPDPPSDE